MSTMNPFQVAALVRHVEFLADTFGGDLNGTLLDTFKQEKTTQAFQYLLIDMAKSTDDDAFTNANIAFDIDAPIKFKGRVLNGVSTIIPLDEDQTMHLFHILLENGEQLLTFSHDGLSLTSSSGWSEFDQTTFTTLRDNTLPIANYVVGKHLTAFRVHGELESLKNYAVLTWNKEGLDNKALSDVKSICAFTDKVYPDAKAEEAALKVLPNGLDKLELLDVDIADALCDTVTENIEDEGASIEVMENESLGFFGCAFSQNIAEWDAGKKQTDNLIVDVYSGTPVSDAALIIYSEARQVAHVEIHMNHHDIMHPHVYNVSGLINTIAVAANGSVLAEQHMLDDIIRVVSVFLDDFTYEGTMCEHLTQLLLNTLKEYKTSLESE